jgi:replicative DNA helicase
VIPSHDFQVIDGGKSEGEGSQAWLDRKRSIDPAAEDAVLSNVLLDPTLLDEIRPYLRAEHFVQESRRRAYEACCALRDAGSPVDTVTVGTWLRGHGRLEQVGGLPGLTEVVNAAPALGTAQVHAYARSVLDKYVRRQAHAAGQRLMARCDHDAAMTDQMLAETRTAIDDLAQLLVSLEKSAEAKPVLTRATLQLQAAAQTEGIGARPSGFDRLDRTMAGLHSELILIGARPGMGKTALATAIAVHRAKAGEGVFIASLETNDTELMQRIICAEAGVSVHRCRSGTLSPTDWSRITSTILDLSELRMWLDDTSAIGVAELWSKCRRARMSLVRDGKKLGLVVVDYVQLLRAPAVNMKREEAIASNARMLKAMAQELDCPVLALAQLNRDCEKRPDKRPQLSDLRESGELEQCARTVLLVYRADYYRRANDAGQPTYEAEVHVAKQNNGPQGMIKLRFEETCVRFENLPEGSWSTP